MGLKWITQQSQTLNWEIDKIVYWLYGLSEE